MDETQYITRSENDTVVDNEDVVENDVVEGVQEVQANSSEESSENDIVVDSKDVVDEELDTENLATPDRENGFENIPLENDDINHHYIDDNKNINVDLENVQVNESDVPGTSTEVQGDTEEQGDDVGDQTSGTSSSCKLLIFLIVAVSIVAVMFGAWVYVEMEKSDVPFDYDRYYEAFGLPPGSSWKQISEKYKKLSEETNPANLENPNYMDHFNHKKIKMTYDILSNLVPKNEDELEEDELEKYELEKVDEKEITIEVPTTSSANLVESVIESGKFEELSELILDPVLNLDSTEVRLSQIRQYLDKKFMQETEHTQSIYDRLATTLDQLHRLKDVRNVHETNIVTGHSVDVDKIPWYLQWSVIIKVMDPKLEELLNRLIPTYKDLDTNTKVTDIWAKHTGEPSTWQEENGFSVEHIQTGKLPRALRSVLDGNPSLEKYLLDNINHKDLKDLSLEARIVELSIRFERIEGNEIMPIVKGEGIFSWFSNLFLSFYDLLFGNR
eukprot:TRINITY_DN885_c0_g1_i1.p1 TRINITY_DN885_c0_g1~~TRINITY_DN885_c0_g1_i1.p1  ORF type:complete len:501 (-),score=143.97 TRINITY_DN885_c0_g1_i1:307-1809(-)